MYSQLIHLIAESVDLSDLEKDLCAQYFEPVTFPKNRILEEEGKVPRYLYFVVSGFVRLFHYNDKGEEITTHINCPPGFITSYSNFSSQIISNENVECITQCELLRIMKSDLDTLMKKKHGVQGFQYTGIPTVFVL